MYGTLDIIALMTLLIDSSPVLLYLSFYLLFTPTRKGTALKSELLQTILVQ